MTNTEIIQALKANKMVFQHLLEDVPEHYHQWKPAPDKWCLLEIICHLYDEEREDFRARVKHMLEKPTAPLVSIDPVGWVKARNYMEQDFDAKLKDFLTERAVSIQWLETLENPSWNNSCENPQLGTISANRFLANWLAHDYIHIRQILKVKFAYLNQNSNEDLSYAGNW